MDTCSLNSHSPRKSIFRDISPGRFPASTPYILHHFRSESWGITKWALRGEIHGILEPFSVSSRNLRRVGPHCGLSALIRSTMLFSIGWWLFGSSVAYEPTTPAPFMNRGTCEHAVFCNGYGQRPYFVVMVIAAATWCRCCFMRENWYFCHTITIVAATVLGQRKNTRHFFQREISWALGAN